MSTRGCGGWPGERPEATLLAAAGLDRLGRPDVGAAIPIATMLPAPAQGAVGIEALAARADLVALLAAIDHPPTSAAVLAERAFLAALGADCRSPVAALAEAEGAALRLRGAIYSADGSLAEEGETVFPAGDATGPQALGARPARARGTRAAPALHPVRPLLILRPEPGGARTARRAAALGLTPLVAPLFAVAAVDWDPPPAGSFDALMLTSAHAARLAGAGLARYRHMPLYAVGAATAAAAPAFPEARIGRGDAAALLARVAADGIGRLLHLAGAEHRAAAVPNVSIDRRIVYRADPVTTLPDPARAALTQGAVALLHSPPRRRGLRGLVGEAGLDRSSIPVAAISPAAAAAAGGGWRALLAADLPDDDALLAVAARLCDKPPG